MGWAESAHHGHGQRRLCQEPLAEWDGLRCEWWALTLRQPSPSVAGQLWAETLLTNLGRVFLVNGSQ